MDNGYENLNPLQKILFEYKLFECDPNQFIRNLQYLKVHEKNLKLYEEMERLKNDGYSYKEIGDMMNRNSKSVVWNISLKREIEKNKHLFDYL